MIDSYLLADSNLAFEDALHRTLVMGNSIGRLFGCSGKKNVRLKVGAIRIAAWRGQLEQSRGPHVQGLPSPSLFSGHYEYKS